MSAWKKPPLSSAFSRNTPSAKAWPSAWAKTYKSSYYRLMTGVALRLAGFLALLVIGASLVTYLVTQDRRWLRFGWQVLKYSLVLVLIVVAFLALERLVLAI